jgi:hypothetical protein
MRKTGPAIAAALLVCVLAGCSSGSSNSADRPADDPNLLAGCGPLPDQIIATHLNAPAVRQQTSPTICTWRADYSGGGTVDIAYSWLQNDTLSRDAQVAAQQGYRVDKLVVKKFGGMYWRDPGDPGSCGVTVADTGTVTWWVENRNHAARPDPCPIAMGLIQATLSVDGV